MKRFAILSAVAVAMFVGASAAKANWGSLRYGGWQPWWNIFATRNHHMSPEERRLQQFWHDYYDALRRYYDLLDNIDWVSYYKNHGYQINAGGGGGYGPCGGPQRVQFAPVFVSPSMQWAVPNSALMGPPMQPPAPPPGIFAGQMGGHMLPPGMGGHMPPPPMGGHMPASYPPRGMMPPQGMMPPPGMMPPQGMMPQQMPPQLPYPPR